ncbi:MAG: hydrogenase expression/formation protein HypE [Candidatus Omnitrophica bacterium]|nr:hydrogenase expression/formation protein HypE [Candidatus Omnitrophota bacterium]
MSEKVNEFTSSCPIPIQKYPNVTLAHGGGGKLTHQLIEKMFIPAFKNSLLGAQHDAAVISMDGMKLAFTTDSFVVQPLFFPGGDIGTLAVNGTVNDLAMCGAWPLYLSAGFIIEEGLAMETLWRVVQSMQRSAQAAGVQLVTGDTKVVEKGKGDGIFINTAGIGIVEHEMSIQPKSVRPGDEVLISGDIGRHGIAIMAMRENLSFESQIESDCAPLAGMVQQLVNGGVDIHCLRDLTRGGLASALCEISESAKVQIQLDESRIPVREDVRGACEILGFDPLYVANEGRFALFVPKNDAEKALAILKAHPLGTGAAIVGSVREHASGLVTAKNCIGTTRIVDMLSGEQLPRIC